MRTRQPKLKVIELRESPFKEIQPRHSKIKPLTLMVSITWVWLFRTSTALLWVMSSKLTPLAARIWSPILMPCCSAIPPGSSLRKGNRRLCICIDINIRDKCIMWVYNNPRPLPRSRERFITACLNVRSVRTLRRKFQARTLCLLWRWTPGSSPLRWWRDGRFYAERRLSRPLTACVHFPPPPFAGELDPP